VNYLKLRIHTGTQTGVVLNTFLVWCMYMKLELQELKIPTGWYISYNQFYNIAPSKAAVEAIDTVFNEDILQFKNEHRNRVIDLGWYPEGDYDLGSYGLVVYEGDFQGKLLCEIDSKNKDEIVSEINRLLLEIAEGYL